MNIWQRVKKLEDLLKIRTKTYYQEPETTSVIIEDLTARLSALESEAKFLRNRERALNLIEEAKSLGFDKEVTYGESGLLILDGNHFGYNFLCFECEIISPLRKSKLDELRTKKKKK